MEDKGEYRRVYCNDNYIVFKDGDILSLISDDFLKLNIGNHGYKHVALYPERKDYCIHRLVYFSFNPQDINSPLIIDHQDRDKLNNNLNNLRLVTQSINVMNKNKQPGSSSLYKYICWVESRKYFVGYIQMNGKLKYIGNHTDEKELAKIINQFIIDHKLPQELNIISDDD